MDPVTVLKIVALAAAIVLSGLGMWGIVEGVKTARSVRVLSDRLFSDVPPLIERASLTLDAVNAEILRVDGVVAQIEEVSDRVNTTARAAQDFVDVPVAAVSGVAESARRVFGALFGRRA
jgi:hypothetical protein